MLNYNQTDVTSSILAQALHHIEHKHHDAIATILEQPMPFAGAITFQHLSSSDTPDPNPDNPTLRILLESVYVGCATILGGMTKSQSITLEESFVRGLCAQLYGKLRLMPHRDEQGTIVYRQFHLSPRDYPSADSFATVMVAEFQQLCQSYYRLCALRNERLYEFYFGQSDERRMYFMPHVEVCLNDITCTRREIEAFSINFDLPNPLVGIRQERPDTAFDNAVGFDMADITQHQALDDDFALIPAEEEMLQFFANHGAYAWYDIRQSSPELFHFSFSSTYEIEEQGVSIEQVHRHEQDRMYQVLLERTMLIGFYTYCAIEKEILSAQLYHVPRLRACLLKINKRVTWLRNTSLGS